ncbi:hypothetical protein EGJ52_04130 [Pseudomonas luteola]|uniref:hypothetical protein n=1 Tax=Pseudomonas luteola TaxID=47886 RepID=UPI000F779CCB|nr:hypothetical protein [Pseudomonas luteola]RRW46559.1 hypothetical protein EGJ52_04130 [Pseudomonas luteola]
MNTVILKGYSVLNRPLHSEALTKLLDVAAKEPEGIGFILKAKTSDIHRVRQAIYRWLTRHVGRRACIRVRHRDGNDVLITVIPKTQSSAFHQFLLQLPLILLLKEENNDGFVYEASRQLELSLVNTAVRYGSCRASEAA